MENHFDRYNNEATLAKPNYYNEIVRRLLFTAGIIMLIGLPLFYANIAISAYIAVLGILIVNIIAGFTSSRHRFTLVFDSIISLIGLFCFELIAVFWYGSNKNFWDSYFWFNQVLAILFFISLYFSIKTFRISKVI